jgi:transposase-like protein
MGTSSGARKRNRSWPDGLKREIVAAALAPGSSVSKAARAYDVNANQLFAWCKRFREEAAASPEMRLLPVTVTPDPTPAPQPDEKIEIDLPSGHRVRIGAGVQSATLQRVLDVLERR